MSTVDVEALALEVAKLRRQVRIGLEARREADAALRGEFGKRLRSMQASLAKAMVVIHDMERLLREQTAAAPSTPIRSSRAGEARRAGRQ